MKTLPECSYETINYIFSTALQCTCGEKYSMIVVLICRKTDSHSSYCFFQNFKIIKTYSLKVLSTVNDCRVTGGCHTSTGFCGSLEICMYTWCLELIHVCSSFWKTTLSLREAVWLFEAYFFPIIVQGVRNVWFGAGTINRYTFNFVVHVLILLRW